MKNYVLFFLIFLTGCMSMGKPKITPEEQRMITAKAAIAEDVRDEKMVCLDKTAMWKGRISDPMEQRQYVKLLRVVMGEDFEAIHCYPEDKNATMDNFDIFINKKDGQVLHILRGE